MTPKPPLVCNTGPLIALNLLDLEPILPLLFSPLVPAAVVEEVRDGNTEWPIPEAYQIIPSTRPNPLLESMLDVGETAVIQAAIDAGIPLLLMDEKKGRSLARRIYGLKTIGTARVLVEARRAGLISPLPELFDKLKKRSYWISEDIVRWALNEAGD